MPKYPANIYEYFAAFTRLPILIDDIRDHALESGPVDRIEFLSVPIDPNILWGMHRLFEERAPDGTTKKVAQIFWSSAIKDLPRQRLICCKEILHIFDDERQTARTTEAVANLIDQILIPPSSGISASAMSDQIGMMHALMVLLPRDALDELRPAIESGKISEEDLANLADIPEAYARLALSPVWTKILDSIE